MNLVEIAKFAASLPLSAFIINPGKAKIEAGYSQLPPAYTLPDGRKYYPADTSLSIHVDGFLLKVDDGEAIDEGITGLQARVVYKDKVTTLTHESEKATIGENGAEVIFTTRRYQSLLGQLNKNALNPNKVRESRVSPRNKNSA